jgi:hypothetical protein
VVGPSGANRSAGKFQFDLPVFRASREPAFYFGFLFLTLLFLFLFFILILICVGVQSLKHSQNANNVHRKL